MKVPAALDVMPNDNVLLLFLHAHACEHAVTWLPSSPAMTYHEVHMQLCEGCTPPTLAHFLTCRHSCTVDVLCLPP